MIINLRRGTVQQEEDSRVLAAIPRYTIKLLCVWQVMQFLRLLMSEAVVLIYML